MSLLKIFPDSGPEHSEVLDQPEQITQRLSQIGVTFERWSASRTLGADASQEDILEAYAEPVARLKDVYGFQSADVISVRPDNPQRVELRAKFLSEHIHTDFEVRFFVEGRGLFFLHPDDKVYAVLCERGDLISVPANVKHWFDMGEFPELKCIRLFTTPEGWVAQFTGSDIAERFPELDAFLAERA